MKDWLERLELKTLFIEPASRCENGYNASFHGTLRYELLDVAWFDILLEVKVLIERRRMKSNTIRPHSPLGYPPPAPKAIQTWSTWQNEACRSESPQDK